MLKKRAFSLVELSIVIVIIGLLVAGVVGSKHIMKKARVNSARSITASSPINSTLDNELWLDVALDDVAFGDGHGLENGDRITSWSDKSYNQDKPQIVVVGNGPKYSNSIASIPAILFESDSDSNHLQISDASFLNQTDYTFIITEQRVAQNSGINYLIGGNDDEDVFGLGYSSNGAIIQSHGEVASSDNSAAIENLDSYSNKPRVITFTHSASDGNRIYINGTLANEDLSATAHLTDITSLNIGKNYHGEIGEIAIFSRAIKQVEIQDIENYMADKFNAPNNRNVVTDCSNGIILNDGCDLSCAINVVNGLDSQILPSGSSSSYSCGSGYTGSTPVYSCVNGVLSPSPSATDCYDNGCDSGYLEQSNQCVLGCSVDSITGTSVSNTVVADGTNVTCDVAGFDGSLLGTCSSGVAISGTCNCETGYTGSNCDSCDTGYLENGELCEQGCVVQNITGTSNSNLTVASGVDVTCDMTGFDGSSLGVCSPGNVISGSCGCDTGYLGSDCATCDTDYSDNDNNGTCEQDCTFTSVSGIIDDTKVESGTTSVSCNDPSASSGNVTYTCNDGVLDNVVNNCVIDVCSGGDTIDDSSISGYTMHIYTSTTPATFQCSQSLTAQILVVAGGGGAGGTHQNYGSGGGGAGGLVYDSSFSVVADTSYTVVVGAGGSGGAKRTTGSNGSNSQFDSIVAIGGAGGTGATRNTTQTGGSGSGASSWSTAGNGTSGQGNRGGYSVSSGSSSNYRTGGGGGGAGEVGQNGGGSNDTNSYAGDGGDGLYYGSVFSNNYGENGWFAGGGSGGRGKTGPTSYGGNGGGGNLNGHAQSATGGGGGGPGADAVGKNGGSGIVIIKYANP